MALRHWPFVFMIVFGPSDTRRRSERSQSFARIVIAIVVGIYIAGMSLVRPDAQSLIQASWIVLAFFVFSLSLYISVRVHPRTSALRRTTGIIADLALTSYCMYITGSFGAFFYAIYLWVIVGNGLRFGVRYLFLAMALGVIGFAGVIAASEYWNTNLNLAAGLLIGMIILPLFYASMLHELEEMNHKLESQVEETVFSATHDSLTGLPNRYLFMDRFHQSVGLATRHSLNIAVLFIDIDRFKQVNDTLGHSAGDDLLCQIGSRIKQCLRSADTVARLGGDEFTVLLTNLNAKKDVIRAAERLLEIFIEPFAIAGKTLNVTGSVGYSLFPEHGSTIDTLLDNADKAMYKAKGQGGNKSAGIEPDD